MCKTMHRLVKYLNGTVNQTSSDKSEDDFGKPCP